MAIISAGGMPVQGGDVPALNTSLIDIPAGAGVVYDVSTVPTGDSAITVTVPLAAGSVAKPAGIAVDTIKVGKVGRVRQLGSYPMTASGTVTYGDYVQIDATAAHMGQAKTKGATVSQLGVALNTAADGELVLVRVATAANV